MKTTFELKPFPGIKFPKSIEIRGSLSKTNGNLEVEFYLEGKLDQLDIPVPKSKPTREEKLWEGTCFEVFFSPKGQSKYWELNLSPSRDWNLYCFDEYRLGMKREPGLDKVSISTRLLKDALKASTTLELSRLSPSTPGFESASLDFGVSSVLRSKEGDLSYWALSHQSDQPDFHSRESFTLRL